MGRYSSWAPGRPGTRIRSARCCSSRRAIQEALNGKTVDWMEKVGDEQYRK